MEIVLIFFVSLMMVILIRSMMEDKRKVEKWKQEFRDNFGKENTGVPGKERLEIISRYSKKRQTKNTIDEQTWKDLDMDEVYCQMAYTNSSLGDDYLYYLLQNPTEDEMILSEREKKVSVLKEQEEIRIKLQVLYKRIGRIKKYSFSEYLEYLLKEKSGKNGKHYVVDILILLTLPLMYWHIGIGLTTFFCLILYNIVDYFKEKARFEPYLTSLRYLLKNLEYAKELETLLPKEWDKEKKLLKEILASMKKVQKNSWLLMSPGRMTGEGLELVLDYVRMCFHIDIIKFNCMLRQLQQYQCEIWKLYGIMGEAEACIAIAHYREFLPQICTPVFHQDRKIRMEEGYHPLIKGAVSNTLNMKKNVLLTGSNASGKSTFLRTIGINVLLAQTIHTCAARCFEMPFCKLYTSMSLKDSLNLKESYYMAEIKAIKRILDAAAEEKMIVCMVDEVLRGTNTIERIAASTQILKSMAKDKILCVASTHDIELTETLTKEYENYHFEEAMEKADVVFSYRLKPGRTESSNAVNLLEHLGYDKKLIFNARKMITNFIEQGEWICE